MKFTKDSFYVQKLALKPLRLKVECDKFKNFDILWICSVCCIFVGVSIMRHAIGNPDSVDEFSESVAPGIQCLTAMCKFSVLIRKQKTMAKIITKLRRYMDQATPEEEKILIEENNHDKFLSGCFHFMGISAGLASLITAPSVMIIIYLNTGNFSPLLPYKGNFILDLSKWYNYLVMYIITCMSAFFVVNLTIFIDTLLSWYCHNIAAQFRIIHIKLMEAHKKYEKDAVELEAAVISCIKHHQDIIAIAEELSKLYEFITFVQYSLCSIQLCVIAYQITQGVVITQLPYLISYLVAVCVQMSVYSYNGDRLMNESQQLAIGIYESLLWKYYYLKPRKLLMLAMCRAQKPVILSGIFFSVDWNLFVEVIKTAASYVTLMKSLAQ